uniref:Transcription elongation factor 1 homolog n=1 Tax=Aegilops tauschii TaxID=37682 RepID=N1R567_AEGTA
MGKRKSARSKAAPRKKVEKLETAFCSHAAAVECTIELDIKIATASCYVCLESYSTVPDALTEPIDVYSEWIDECERVNEGVRRRARMMRGRHPALSEISWQMYGSYMQEAATSTKKCPRKGFPPLCITKQPPRYSER